MPDRAESRTFADTVFARTRGLDFAPRSAETRAMILSQTALYALRAMATLAQLAPGASLRAPEIAESTDTPVHYVSKVMRKLVLRKLVRGQRGHGGGFQLARPPAAIRLADVLEAVGVVSEPEACAFGWVSCDPDQPCPLHPVWSRLKDSYTKWSEEITLADLPAAAPPDRAQRRRAVK